MISGHLRRRRRGRGRRSQRVCFRQLLGRLTKDGLEGVGMTQYGGTSRCCLYRREKCAQSRTFGMRTLPDLLPRPRSKMRICVGELAGVGDKDLAARKEREPFGCGASDFGNDFRARPAHQPAFHVISTMRGIGEHRCRFTRKKNDRRPVACGSGPRRL